ncbi:MAG TPA: FMN-binding negative transcriptional regulator [Ilumatobacteraceae bacterium]|nr:FMN-binding negative transcriptional regulator [Ilumatobacteraceae bacterium]
MYARPTDRVESRTTALELLQAASFVHLVSNGASGFEATSLPMIVDRESDRLIGHLARANDHWRALDEQPVVVIAVASESYVSPSWYPSKSASGGRVVPTWNYEAVHVHGVARLHHDPEWLTAVVGRLTEVHESRRTDGSDRWAVSDAPADFIALQLKAIVGLSVSIDRIDAKQKLSANRSEPDQAGVMEGLSETLGAPTRMIEAMACALEADHER